MSRFTLTLLCVAVGVIILATLAGMPFTSGVSGALLVIALGYSYVVAKREVELLNYASKQKEREQEERRAPARMPEAIS